MYSPPPPYIFSKSGVPNKLFLGYMQVMQEEFRKGITGITNIIKAEF